MSERIMQSVLRCEQCNKLFDKQTTLKRHGYYCRSLRAGRNSRNRSCVSCAKAKTRCDNSRPSCSKCATKAIECHYPTNTPRSTEPRAHHGDDAPTESQTVMPSFVANSSFVATPPEASINSGMIFDSELVISDLEFASFQGQYPDWDDPNIDFAGYLNPQTNDHTVHSSGSLSAVNHPTPSTDMTVQSQQAISPFNLSIPAVPTTYTLRSLMQRPKREAGPQRIANLILHTLKSYPLMILRHDTLPPFIHPRLMSSEVEEDDMEPLSDCLSLMHMISSKTQGSRKLFWKNVRMECERLLEEHLTLNKWQLLAAMQALSIYILLRLQEGETEYNNYDYLLIKTVIVMAQQFARLGMICNMPCTPRSQKSALSWKDWIFEESRRRLSVVFKVVDMLIYFELGAMCNLQKDLVLAPLPAKRKLWEAGDEFVWAAETEEKPGVARHVLALAADGELVNLDERQLYCSDGKLLHDLRDGRIPSSNTVNWEDWCSGMDGFGGLVMLAASLIV